MVLFQNVSKIVGEYGSGTTMLRFFDVYYNFIRKHSSIASNAEKARAVERGKLNCWELLIRKAYFLILSTAKFRIEPCK